MQTNYTIQLNRELTEIHESLQKILSELEKQNEKQEKLDIHKKTSSTEHFNK